MRKRKILLKPKILLTSWFLLTLHALCYADQGGNSRVTFSGNNVQLVDLFKAIKKQTGLTVFYSNEALNEAEKIKVDFNQETVENVLSSVLAKQNFTWTIKGNFIVLNPDKPAAKRQEFTVSGTIKDAETQEVLPGVSVILKGTNIGTTSNVDGNFSLLLSKEQAANGTLSFSYVGYTPLDTLIRSRETLNVTMTVDASSLDEVVVLAYGSQKKATVTGSVASIPTKELVQSPVSNLTNALAGRLPGLITTQRSGEPGVDAASLYVRGVSTINNANPIIMVDGVERSMDYLDPNDVESVTILKDAAATAVLGMRGANGAVLVTTKRGKAGKPEVSFRASTGFQEATRIPEYLGSYDYARLYNEAITNDGGQIAFSDEELEGYRNGTLPNIDHYAYMMRPSNVTQGNLNVSGGTDIARYFISAGYNRAEGNYRHTSDNEQGFDGNNLMNRYNLRANVDVDITKTLSARVDLAGIITQRRDGNNSASSIMNLANRMPPIFPLFNEDGSLWGNGTFTQNLHGELSRKGYRNFFNNTTQGTFSLKRKLDFITKNLSGQILMAYDQTNNPSASYTRDYAVFEPLYNNGGELTGYRKFRDDTQINPDGSFNGGGLNRNTYLEASLNWNGTFGNHNVSAMALVNRRLQNNNSEIPFAYESSLFRGTYDYKQRYLLEISASYQGSENFPPGSRYGLFPSISAGWVLSEESFLKDVAFINFLKLRTSYGEVGNDRSGGDRFLWFTSWRENPSDHQNQYFFGTGASRAAGWQQEAVGNPGVTWERGRQFNVGLEASLFRDILSFTLDVFKERRSNILITRNSLSDVFGQNIKPQNLGIVDNHGFELEVIARQQLGDFSYTVRPNITFARNNRVFFDEVARAYPWMRRTGTPIDTKFGLIADGFFENQAAVDAHPYQNFSDYGPGDIRYVKLTGDEYDYIQPGFDETVIGRPRTPEYMFGTAIELAYKNFDVSVLFQGATGADVMLENEAVYEFFQGGKVKPFHLNRWTPETAATATYPSLHSSVNGNNHRASSFWVRSADYLRLKNFEIGYRLPRNIVEAINLSFFRIYANGMNLFTWDKLKDWQVDPEIGDGNGAMYPIQRIWNFGIDVRF
ncbi:TonB-dependent receptor [Olivibacter sp. SDN3]|uniref:TonB-dependent receptor n=1 Tax=Olivibacter sp. SDN3 TaxID=2764720 RepID=UPI0016510DBD|nr:TonB-dependent receptor [Olivibacter sp. SDN3]QNL51010.1 TonB-dependent receptor [Olivibacter sp. SDN3]